MSEDIKGTRSEEYLAHFKCGACEKWWSIGDAPEDKTYWFCPWCGTEQEVSSN